MPEEAKHSTSATPALPTDQMLTEDAVSKILDVSPSWLAKARMRGTGPPFVKVGRNVRYFPLGPWLAARRRPLMKKRRPLRQADDQNNSPSQYTAIHEDE